MDSLSSKVSLLVENATTTTTSSMHLSSSSQIERAFKTLFLVVIALANITGNSSICLVVFKDRHLRVTVRNYAVASLAMSDLLAVQIMIFQILNYFNIGKEPHICNLMGRIFGCLLYVSTLHLFFLSMDRYVAIFYPLRYRFLVTTRRVAAILLTIWIIPLFSIHILPAVMTDLRGFSSFYGCIEEGFIEESDIKNHVHMCINVAFLFFFPLFAMMAAYYRISKIAWYQANRVGIAVARPVVRLYGGRFPRARDRKWARTLAIVIGAFLGCYLPMVVASLVHIYAGGTTNHSLTTTLEILLFLTFLNTVLNPMIYSLRSYEYRRAFNKICRRCFRDSSNNRWSRVNFITQELESQTMSTFVNTPFRKDSDQSTQ